MFDFTIANSKKHRPYKKVDVKVRYPSELISAEITQPITPVITKTTATKNMLFHPLGDWSLL